MWRQLQPAAGGVVLVNGAMPEVGSGGQVAFWIGAAICTLSALYVYRSINFTSHAASSQAVYRLSLASLCTLGLSNFFCALGFLPSAPFGRMFDFTWLTYATWVFKTPMLLLLLAHLAQMGSMARATLVLFTELMVGIGWIAQTQGDPNYIWPLFTLGAMPQVGIFAMVSVSAFACARCTPPLSLISSA
jgi:bacteriorhodopsin